MGPEETNFLFKEALAILLDSRTNRFQAPFRENLFLRTLKRVLRHVAYYKTLEEAMSLLDLCPCFYLCDAILIYE